MKPVNSLATVKVSPSLLWQRSWAVLCLYALAAHNACSQSDKLSTTASQAP